MVFDLYNNIYLLCLSAFFLFSYGGKFGVQKDRMDKSAMGHDFIAKVDKHDSQKDYKTGFGGKFGVQSDRVDKSAMGWEHVEKVDKHNSQQGWLFFMYSVFCLL